MNSFQSEESGGMSVFGDEGVGGVYFMSQLDKG